MRDGAEGWGGTFGFDWSVGQITLLEVCFQGFYVHPPGVVQLEEDGLLYNRRCDTHGTSTPGGTMVALYIYIVFPK